MVLMDINNVYNTREVYTIRGDMCYDNKAMTTTLPEPPVIPQAVINLEKSQEISSSPPLKFRRRLRSKSVADVLIFVTVILLMNLIEFDIIPSTKLGFTCQDPALSYPYRGDTISATTLLVGSFFGSLFFIICIEAVKQGSLRRVCVGTVWQYYRECLIGTALVLLITEIIKVLVGEHRPHFFDSCEPAELHNCKPGSFIPYFNCTNTRMSKFFRGDISKSFPSGHTAISFFIALYCSYLVQNRLPSEAVSKLTKPLFIVVCLTWSLVCSLSRITDRRHHWWDVLAGACLGFFGAVYTLSVLEVKEKPKQLRMNTSTTTLLDVKNKDAASVII